MIIKKYLIVFLLVWIGQGAVAQINIDSLNGVWNDKTAADTTRLDALQKITWEVYLFSMPDSGFYYGQVLSPSF
ncbi:MAG: hypothetical protein ACYC1Q_09215 [Bacteroidia bacterium]